MTPSQLLRRSARRPFTLSLSILAILVVGSTHRISAQSAVELVDAQLISIPQADYPKVAMDAFVGGKVNVRVDIDAQGRVTNAAIAFGPDWVCPNVATPTIVALREAAVAAALQAKFSPAMNGSVPTSSSSIITVDFKAERAPEIADPAGTGAPVPPGDRHRMISGGVLNSKAVKLPAPAYPAAAKAVEASGSVAIQVVIAEDGTIYSAKAVSGHPLLRRASEIAACSAAFAPTLLQGQPIRVSGVIMYNFNL